MGTMDAQVTLEAAHPSRDAAGWCQSWPMSRARRGRHLGIVVPKAPGEFRFQ